MQRTVCDLIYFKILFIKMRTHIWFVHIKQILKKVRIYMYTYLF